MVHEGLLGSGEQRVSAGNTMLEARFFITIATPHLGVRRPDPQHGLGWAFHTIGTGLGRTSKTIQEMLLEDDPDMPMLRRLVQDDYLKALRIFEKRSCYANVFYDFMVPFSTSAFEESNPFQDRSSRSIRRMDSFRSIAGEELNDEEAARNISVSTHLSKQDPKRPLLDEIRGSLQQLGWRKFPCVLPAFPNAHNAIVGNSACSWQGKDIADHIARQVLDMPVDELPRDFSAHTSKCVLL